jgi:hypothetical protein
VGTIHKLGVPSTELKEFLDFIYGDVEGYAYSPTKNPVTGAFEQYFFKWPLESGRLIDHINRYSATHEVYYGPALFSRADATKEAFLGTNVLWAEFDGSTPTLRELDGVPTPAIKIQSSTAQHEHWYWKLDGFISDMSLLEDISQRLTYHLKADLSCWNANRVLRPPGTTHHESARQTQQLRFELKTNSITDFIGLPELPVKLLGFSDIHVIPDVADAILKYSFSEEAVRLFREKKIEKGGRSSALTKLAHFCMEMDMSNAETLSILYNADERWKKFTNRTPDNRKERLIGIINYTRARHPINPVEKDTESIFKVFSFEEFMATELNVEWLVEGLLHKKGLVSISGPAGLGKSQVSIRFAEKAAKGEQFLRWKIPRPIKTIFVSLEMAHEELKYFMETMDIEKNDLLRENMMILPVGSSMRLNNKVTQRELNKVIDKYQPEGIIIDSFGVAVGEDLNSDKIVLETMDYIHKTLRLHYGLFVWFIHHPRKEQIGNKKPKKLDDLHGSGYFGRAVSTAIGLWKEGNEIEVSCLKMRMSEEFAPFRIKRTPTLDFQMISGSSPKEPSSLMPNNLEGSIEDSM